MIVRRGHLIAVVGTFLIAYSVLLLMVGCAGTRSEAPEEGQGHIEATDKEQGHSLEARSEEARCDGTRTFKRFKEVFTTNDLPGCSKGGLLLGTDKKDNLYGGEGDDEIRGLGAYDVILGGSGDDVIYGGAGVDEVLIDGKGDDVIYGDAGADTFEEGPGANVFYGGDGNDVAFLGRPKDGQIDKFYCGKGKDQYAPPGALSAAPSAPPDAKKKSTYVDYMDSCEKKAKIKVVF